MTLATAKSFEKILANANLPALPQSAIHMLQVSQDPDAGPVEYAIPIETDPGLTGQVLRFVNSSYFGFSREISSVRLAITLVGVKTIKNFVLWSAVFSLMPSPKCGPFDLRTLWQDSLRRALFARQMGNLCQLKDAEELFAAALLQDMAVPLLAKEDPDLYTRLLTARKQGQRRLSTVEMACCGWNHAQAAGWVGRRWNLPERFVELIENHLMDVMTFRPNETDLGCAIVALSAALPPVSDAVWHEKPLFEAGYRKLFRQGFPEPEEVLATVDQAYAEIAPLLRITIPGRSLLEVYQGKVSEEKAAADA
ncbi:metal dependent phosphohydrolase [Thermogutta terrifontis]|jgi:HD-like signal output (HDOD) protein|uniref:Metal dependent phosphohydrolase n=1 Tax=Thermogutta terrifontis TaxID=1331910 RepID=A0A286RE47_9BACT|nr:HDOD domain-containing protein [Thermogutta terrifontis]ASV74238.1 metal dependent phosphohydrolase [Thermogutta terrifontis]